MKSRGVVMRWLATIGSLIAAFFLLFRNKALTDLLENDKSKEAAAKLDASMAANDALASSETEKREQVNKNMEEQKNEKLTGDQLASDLDKRF